jgi:hypothetical protein
MAHLLVSPDLSKGDRSRTVSVRLLDASGSSGRSLSGGLGSELLPGSLSSGRLSSGLLVGGREEGRGGEDQQRERREGRGEPRRRREGKGKEKTYLGSGHSDWRRLE